MSLSAPKAPVSSEEQENTPKQPLYEGSTQFRNWRFSVESLAKVRGSMNEAAVAAIRRKIEADEPGSSSDIAFLKPDEEVLLVKFYIAMLAQLCAKFKFPEEVEATGVTYLKRFYLRNTVMDWHPKNIMLTCLFLATKTSNSPLSLKSYTSLIPKTEPADVLDNEFLIAQSLSFEFAVWHAHRALWGLWLDVQTLPDTAKLSPDVYNAALQHIRASRFTDAEFVYTPSQIALAALSLAAPDIAARWLQSKATPEHPVQASVIEAAKSMIQIQSQAPEVPAVREVDRRLRLCKNPEKVPGSKAFLAKKAAEEAKAEERRQQKAAATQQKAMEEGDPFDTEPVQSRPGLVDYDDDDDDDD